jgi:hypothetical protein
MPMDAASDHSYLLYRCDKQYSPIFASLNWPISLFHTAFNQIYLLFFWII